MRSFVAKGQTVTFEETLADMKTRDARDEGRAIAPLERADSAILVDSNAMSIEETVAFMLDHVRTGNTVFVRVSVPPRLLEELPKTKGADLGL